MTKNRMVIGLLVLVTEGMLGCTPQDKPEGATPSPTTHVFNEAALQGAPGARNKHLGEDCTAERQSACDTDVCVKTGAGVGGPHFCSVPCRGEEDCPEAWTCQQVMPGPFGRLCVPPQQWTPRAVGVRP